MTRERSQCRPGGDQPVYFYRLRGEPTVLNIFGVGKGYANGPEGKRGREGNSQSVMALDALDMETFIGKKEAGPVHGSDSC